jgi:RNA polymerase-binding transcription factor
MSDSKNLDTSVVTYSAPELEHFRLLIEEKKKSAQDDIQQMREQMADSRDHAEDDTAYSSHMADAGTDAMEREKLYLMLARQQKYVGYLDRALDRITAGTYGICKVNGTLISKERLESVPHTEISIAAKLDQNKHQAKS